MKGSTRSLFPLFHRGSVLRQVPPYPKWLKVLGLWTIFSDSVAFHAPTKGQVDMHPSQEGMELTKYVPKASGLAGGKTIELWHLCKSC